MQQFEHHWNVPRGEVIEVHILGARYKRGTSEVQISNFRDWRHMGITWDFPNVPVVEWSIPRNCCYVLRNGVLVIEYYWNLRLEVVIEEASTFQNQGQEMDSYPVLFRFWPFLGFSGWKFRHTQNARISLKIGPMTKYGTLFSKIIISETCREGGGASLATVAMAQKIGFRLSEPSENRWGWH